MAEIKTFREPNNIKRMIFYIKAKDYVLSTTQNADDRIKNQYRTRLLMIA